MTNPRYKNWALKIIGVGILFGFFAGWLTVFAALNEARCHRAAQSWESRRGVITQSYVAHRRRGQRREYWRPEIAGTFVGSEDRFSANKVGYGMEFTSNSEAQAARLIAPFPVGRELDVFLDPARPNHVILVRDNSLRTTWNILFIGLFFGLLPFLLYLWGKIRPSVRMDNAT
jgi:hypothetical protein